MAARYEVPPLRKKELTPENFPAVFTVHNVEDIHSNPISRVEDIFPLRYYYLMRPEEKPHIQIVYIYMIHHREAPHTTNIHYLSVYSFNGAGWINEINVDDIPVTRSVPATEFELSRAKFYDIKNDILSRNAGELVQTEIVLPPKNLVHSLRNPRSWLWGYIIRVLGPDAPITMKQQLDIVDRNFLNRLLLRRGGSRRITRHRRGYRRKSRSHKKIKKN